MKTDPDFQNLTKQIEQTVEAHIAASRRAAAAAVERAFASAVSKPAKVSAPGTRTAKIGRRRPPAEIAALADRLYQVVCNEPGETMAVLAPRLDATPRELHRPMVQLKRAGRVRSIGQRHLARYFPLVSRDAESA